MDKYEYKVRSAQIKSLIENGEYREAVKIADTIDWSRVPSVSRLLTISELYMINKRYEESKEILLLARDRHPNGRSIIYRLCEICIKLNEIGYYIVDCHYTRNERHCETCYYSQFQRPCTVGDDGVHCQSEQFSERIGRTASVSS